ncbi:MAG: hypothetical protein MIO93_11650 [ANME-2 cluster archaeon]|nr:hypothetical protein [ANME-2 cluster archaeon]
MRRCVCKGLLWKIYKINPGADFHLINCYAAYYNCPDHVCPDYRNTARHLSLLGFRAAVRGRLLELMDARGEYLMDVRVVPWVHKMIGRL